MRDGHFELDVDTIYLESLEISMSVRQRGWSHRLSLGNLNDLLAWEVAVAHITWLALDPGQDSQTALFTYEYEQYQ